MPVESSSSPVNGGAAPGENAAAPQSDVPGVTVKPMRPTLTPGGAQPAGSVVLVLVVLVLVDVVWVVDVVRLVDVVAPGDVVDVVEPRMDVLVVDEDDVV